MERALKRALKVSGAVGSCRSEFRNVGLIQRSNSASSVGSAALREVSAAERFRRVLDGRNTCPIPTLASSSKWPTIRRLEQCEENEHS